MTQGWEDKVALDMNSEEAEQYRQAMLEVGTALEEYYQTGEPQD